MPKIYQLKITLNDIAPAIWRRVLVNSNTPLPDLHKILQTTMGWTNSHLHDFRCNEVVYGDPDLDEVGDLFEDYSDLKLNDLLKTTSSTMIYDYDFGDSWEHNIVLEAISDADPRMEYPACIAGERACPPEDCGGAPGYEDLLKIIKKPKHPEYEETMEWLPEGYAPEQFDLAEVNEMLQMEDFGCIDIGL